MLTCQVQRKPYLKECLCLYEKNDTTDNNVFLIEWIGLHFSINILVPVNTCVHPHTNPIQQWVIKHISTYSNQSQLQLFIQPVVHGNASSLEDRQAAHSLTNQTVRDNSAQVVKNSLGCQPWHIHSLFPVSTVKLKADSHSMLAR